VLPPQRRALRRPDRPRAFSFLSPCATTTIPLSPLPSPLRMPATPAPPTLSLHRFGRSIAPPCLRPWAPNALLELKDDATVLLPAIRSGGNRMLCEEATGPLGSRSPLVHYLMDVPRELMGSNGRVQPSQPRSNSRHLTPHEPPFTRHRYRHNPPSYHPRATIHTPPILTPPTLAAAANTIHAQPISPALYTHVIPPHVTRL
jgi:hypothetical protein